MKKSQPLHHSRVVLHLVVMLAGCALSPAATYTYSPTSSLADLWSAGTNWSALPVSSLDSTLAFGPSGSFGASPLTNASTNDFASPFDLNVLTLQGSGSATTGAPVAVTIGGGTLNFRNSTASVGPTINLNASNGSGTSTVSYAVNSDITLSNNLTVNGSGSAAFNLGGNITGGGSLTKNGGSTLTLSGNNSFTGGTTLTSGILSLGSAGALGTTGPITFSGGTLQFTGNNTTDYSSRFAGSNYSIDVSGADVGATLASNISSTFTKSGAGTLYLTSNAISDATNLNVTAGKLVVPTLSGFFITGATRVSAGATLELVGTTSINLFGFRNISGTVSASANFPYTAAGSSTVSATLAGTAGISKSTGPGTLTLSGNNSFTGNVTSSGGGGVIKLGAAGDGTNSPLGTTAGSTVISSGALDLNGFTLSTAEPLFLSGTGNSNLGGAFVNSSATAASFDGPVTLQGGITITGTGNITLTNTITGNFDLTKTGANTLKLSGTSTLGGNTTVSAGVLQFAKPASLYNNVPASWNRLSVASGATAAFNVGAVGEFSQTEIAAVGANATFASGSALGLDTTTLGYLYSSAITGGFGLRKLGANTLKLSGNNTYSGNTTVVAGTLQFAKEISFYGNTPASWNKLTVNAGTTAAFNVGGTGEFTETDITAILANATFSPGSALGIDTTNLVGPYTFSRTLASGIGFAAIGANTTTILAAALNAAPLRVDGGILDLHDVSQSVSSLNSTAGTILNDGSATATLTLLAGTTASTNAALIADNDNAGTGKVSVVVANTNATPGVLTLSGPNTFTGGLFIKAGIVSATANSLGGSGTGTVTLGDTSGTGNASLTGGAVTYANPLTIAAGSSGTRRLGSTSASAIFSGAITLNNSLILGNGGSSALALTVSGPITGSSAISIEGGAPTTVVTLSGANTAFTGPVTITTGTLKAGRADALSSANLLTLGNATTFDLNDFSITLAGLAGTGTNGTVTQPSPSTPRTLTLAGGGNASFGGKITAAVPANLSLVVTKDPGASQELTGNASDYVGGTAVHSGTLIVSNGATGSGLGSGPVSVDVGATLAGNFTITGATQIDGTLSPGKNGIGAAKFGGNLTLGSGATTNIEIAGNTVFDTINVGGTFTLGGTFKIITTGGYLAQGSYHFLDWGGLVANGFDPKVNFDFSQAATAGVGGHWDASQFLTTGTITAVPEPRGSAAAIAALLAGILILRLRSTYAGGVGGVAGVRPPGRYTITRAAR